MADDKLILVKHAMPVIVPDLPPRRWLLSDEGRERAARIASELRRYSPAIVVTSDEPKAAETGEIIAATLGVPARQMAGLHEHERGVIPWDGDEVFHERIQRLFDEPAAVVYGNESADRAHARFAAAIAELVETERPGAIVVATHGTVITLLVARANGLAPFPLWRRLDLPSAVVLDRETLRLERVFGWDGAEL